MTHDHDQDRHHEHVPVEYKDAVEGFRLDKDEFFKTQPGSPIPEAERDDFDVDEYLVAALAVPDLAPGVPRIHEDDSHGVL